MKPANPGILTINGGSLRRILKCGIERIGLPEDILLNETFHRRFSDLPQVACFDTAFHHDLPRVARLLHIPIYCKTMNERYD